MNEYYKFVEKLETSKQLLNQCYLTTIEILDFEIARQLRKQKMLIDEITCMNDQGVPVPDRVELNVFKKPCMVTIINRDYKKTETTVERPRLTKIKGGSPFFYDIAASFAASNDGFIGGGGGVNPSLINFNIICYN